MSANIANQVAYLRTSREFPKDDLDKLSLELSKAYIDTATAVNVRTIGIFPVNRPAITGESWFLFRNQKQQTLRQVYNITSYSPFAHGIDFENVTTFTKITGIGFDGTNYYPIPYVSPFAVGGGVGIYVTPTQVIITSAGASPVIVSGIIILEWMSQT